MFRLYSYAVARHAHRSRAAAVLAALALLSAACAPRSGGRSPAPGEARTDTALAAAAHVHGDTGAAAADTAAGAGMGMGRGMGPGRGMGGGMGQGMGGRMMTPPTSPEAIALGDSIFHGKAAGGTCYTCHGMSAKGTELAPDLTDAEWLNGDGSFRFVVHTIMHGISDPVRHPGSMPPMGGAQLTHDQARAVAAYVLSLREEGTR
ncbi:MAG TPA: c-type cytochrome [Gemmatimonadaceae bacterium]